MHLLRALEGAGKYLEFSIEGPDIYPWQEGLFVKSPYDVKDGHVNVFPTSPAGASPTIPNGWRDPATKRANGHDDERLG